MKDTMHVYLGPPRPMTDKQKSFFTAKEPAAPKRHLTPVPDTLITECKPGKAQGLEPTRMRAKGGTREPREMTRVQKLLQLERMKGSIPTSLYLLAKQKLSK